MSDVPGPFLAGEPEAGTRLDVALARWLDEPRSRAAARIERGEVSVDGRPGRRSAKLTAGARVEVAAPTTAPTAPAPPLPPVRYRDEHLLIVAKPPGMVVHAGAGHRSGTLVDALLGAEVPLGGGDDPQRPGIVHRLDRDTSGLLVVASTPDAHAGLVAALAARSVTRRYLAVVAGEPAEPRGRIEAPIGRDPGQRTRFTVHEDGKPAVTRYATLATGDAVGDPVSLLACKLETGRTHQIRVHLTAVGHPIVGDPTYGPRPRLASTLGAERPALHAARLAFRHPVTGADVDVVEPLPDDLLTVLAAAGIAPPDLSTVLQG